MTSNAYNAAFTEGYDAGRAAQENGDEAFAALQAKAGAGAEAATAAATHLIEPHRTVPDAMWDRKDRAVGYANGVNAGGYDVREGRGLPVEAAEGLTATAPVLLTLAQATASVEARAEAHRAALQKWGRASSVTRAAFSAYAAAETLCTLVRSGSTNVAAMSKAHTDLDELAAEADRLFVEGPTPDRSGRRSPVGERAHYGRLPGEFVAPAAEHRTVADQPENRVETTTRTIIRV